MKKKNIKIFITNSLGELDVIIPICIELKKKNNCNIEIIFTVKKVYNLFLSDEFYPFTMNYFQIKYSKLYLTNKFDISGKQKNNKKYTKIIFLKSNHFENAIPFYEN